MTQTVIRSSGDRLWPDAAAATLGELAATVRTRAKRVQDKVDEDAVHDLRTATRRLRTAIKIYGEDAPAADRKPVEKELRRLTRRLGAVRDLDIFLQALAEATRPGPGRLDPGGLKPLRRAWEEERARCVGRLTAELDRDRFRRAVDGAEDLLGKGTAPSGPVVERIAHRAPGLIWEAAGKVLAYELDPMTAEPAAVHELRIAAKKLRYTLEAFEEALEPGASLITSVTALQDAGGKMHDAVVARDRAQAFADDESLNESERNAIRAFARQQDRQAEECRPTVASCLAVVRSRGFRDALGRAVAGMGRIDS